MATDTEITWEDRLTLATFEHYFGYAPGEGPWSEEHDAKQVEHIRKLVKIWQHAIGPDRWVDWAAGLAAARAEPGYVVDRSYVTEVRLAYNTTMEALLTNE